MPLSVLWIVGVTNAFNLVDGLDGLSAGLALISAVSLGAVFLVAGERVTASCVFVLAGALLGFLPFNVYPAKIFLGDTGAASVGFVLACFALKGGVDAVRRLRDRPAAPRARPSGRRDADLDGAPARAAGASGAEAASSRRTATTSITGS